ncbi:MAG: response regulator [Chitinispirillales bacterium]|jgi:CheY-like chemotaxis protein|nr:response regulator [Chitinispirillales bacterium]
MATKLSKESLRTITPLKPPDRLFDKDAALLDNYCVVLFDFVEDFPEFEAAIKKAVVIGDNAALGRNLSLFAETLANIHADGLQQECERLRDGMGAASHDKLEANITDFLASVATLSVDIQMAQHRAEEASKPKTRKYQVIYANDTNSILAVDDIPVTLNLLSAALTKAGYRVTGVTSGAAALDYVEKFVPNLFILDIEMPKMNGFELAVKLREAGQTAPMVFLTGNTTREYLLRAVKLGAVDFIVKPFNADGVTEKINRIFKGAT